VAVDRQFWENYAPYYSKLALSPVYKQFLAHTVALIAARNGERILDLGSGPAQFARLLSDQGAQVTAVDYSEEMMRAGRRAANRRGNPRFPIEFVHADVCQYLKTAASNSFDAVLASLLVSYLDNPAAVVGEIFRVLRPGGRLIMSNPVPNPDFSVIFWKSGWTALRYLFFALQLLRYAAKIKRFEGQGVFHFFSLQETMDLLANAGFPRRSIAVTRSLADTVYVSIATKPW
jgi:ubiquinone/menaquinone biosynthesis C-methylase UbiE